MARKTLPEGLTVLRLGKTACWLLNINTRWELQSNSSMSKCFTFQWRAVSFSYKFLFDNHKKNFLAFSLNRPFSLSERRSRVIER